MSCSSDMYPNCKNNAIGIIKAVFILLPESIIMPPVRSFMYICIQPKSLQSSASAPTHIMRGCSQKRVFTLDPTSWSIKEVVARRTRQSDYIALTLSLNHRSLTVGLLYSPWWLRTHPNSGCVHVWLENGPSLRRRNSNIPIGH